MIAPDIHQVNQVRKMADIAFKARRWTLAACHLKHCARLIGEIWKRDLLLPAELRPLARNIEGLLAYALAKTADFEAAVLALENGPTRYLDVVAATRNMTDFVEVNEIKYLQAAQDLFVAKARERHRLPRHDDLPKAINLQLVIHNTVKGADAARLNAISAELEAFTRDKAKAAQLMNVFFPILEGRKPVEGFVRDPEFLTRAFDLFKEQGQILRRYDFSNVVDPVAGEEKRARETLRDCSSRLSEDWFDVTWEN
ncbi:hypothetical protein XH81_04000 [Bradyrhizobium sp. CCBAU 25360]|uniref:hypothetical protein n=1 Tax=Bradyrhizobium sp. CCBAU 25360 TaxID=858425 RepID=UPI0023056760|nr:hypothetical protein [Bradyrhizobium sp. CCBAU 25360]MDA9414032.1 hypothetical protein [Bradyrhizobium sp. CCBAU 25360]